MTTSQMKARRGEVWLVRFPFTDLSITRNEASGSVNNPLGLDTSLRSYSAGAEVEVGQKKALHLE